ncbi:uncharacterized protein LOC135810882 isoform X2 [Sycon ciliatum]|uniref:uncharacterized protein LOC135810882 isoform X2 n=1 Tax=Sycon ciliatum TaxID=27933 RepID=UPI0031F624A8
MAASKYGRVLILTAILGSLLVQLTDAQYYPSNDHSDDELKRWNDLQKKKYLYGAIFGAVGLIGFGLTMWLCHYCRQQQHRRSAPPHVSSAACSTAGPSNMSLQRSGAYRPFRDSATDAESVRNPLADADDILAFSRSRQPAYTPTAHPVTGEIPTAMPVPGPETNSASSPTPSSSISITDDDESVKVPLMKGN